MLISFTIHGVYQSNEEDPEEAIKGLTDRELVANGQVNRIDFEVDGNYFCVGA